LSKYSLKSSKKNHFSSFDEKLRTKNQSGSQRQQARQAIAVYYQGIVGTQCVARLKNQAEAMAQAKYPVQLPQLNPIDAINPSQLSV